MSLNQPAPLQMTVVQTPWQALVVRRLRNTCCTYLTNYRQPISLWQQLRWFYRVYRPALQQGLYRAYLFTPAGRAPIGYTALSLQAGALYITECLAPAARSQGYGSQMLTAMLALARAENRPVVAEIWADNVASLRLHTRAGFVHIEERLHHGAVLQVYRFTPV